MKIEITYKNKDLKIVGTEEFNLDDYCRLLSQKTLSLLYQIEDLENKKIEFNEIRKYILNLAGSIQRLPENLKDINSNDIKLKTPNKSFFDFLKRRD
ncbi:MAG: hypothetical protein ACM3O3_12815 [Syntrophothermus sp.]